MHSEESTYFFKFKPGDYTK